MRNRIGNRLRVLLAGFCGLVIVPAAAGEEFSFYHENVLGTSLELRVEADRETEARGAEDRVLGAIDRLAKIFSSYDGTSEFRLWQDRFPAPGPAGVSPELFTLLAACDDWRDRSGGAFDPRVQTLTQLWSRSAAANRTPTLAELADVRALMSRPAWQLDRTRGTALRLSDGPLTLNSIAKGEIIERACAAGLGSGRGIRSLLLNIGGDVRVCGERPSILGIAPAVGDSESTEPHVYIEVQGKAVATSGRAQRGLRIGGKWYSHIFDPRTGKPADGIASATVIADRSADANALATTFNILKPEESLRLAATVPGAECLIVTFDGRVVRSEGWRRYERERPPPTSNALALADTRTSAGQTDAAPGPGQPWGNEFELLVNFEINHPDAEGGRYRRPFVAVWVEDKNGFPVRNLMLWVSLGGPGPWEWLKDLKRWYLSDQIRKKVDRRDMVLTMSRPTRPPGKYSVIWDGKDDHGKAVDRGEYTLFIDAAREHGTYQSIRVPLTLGETPLAGELEGNIEMKAASFEYRRKTAVRAP